MLKEATEETVQRQSEMLETYRDTLQEEILNAQTELNVAKAKQKLTGEYINPEQFMRLKTDVHRSTVELHEVNRKIKALKKDGGNHHRAMLFQEAAKEILDEELYRGINDLANKRFQKFERLRSNRQNT